MHLTLIVVANKTFGHSLNLCRVDLIQIWCLHRRSRLDHWLHWHIYIYLRTQTSWHIFMKITGVFQMIAVRYYWWYIFTGMGYFWDPRARIRTHVFFRFTKQPLTDINGTYYNMMEVFWNKIDMTGHFRDSQCHTHTHIHSHTSAREIAGVRARWLS